MSHLLSCHSHLDLTQTILSEKTENKKCKKSYPCTGVCLKVTVFAAGTNITGFTAAQLVAEFG